MEAASSPAAWSAWPRASASEGFAPGARATASSSGDGPFLAQASAQRTTAREDRRLTDAARGPLLVERLEVGGIAAVDAAHAAPMDEVLDLEAHRPPLAELHPEPGAAGGHHPQPGAPVGRRADRVRGLELDLRAPHPGAGEEHEPVA